jgi:hypothetical protein
MKIRKLADAALIAALLMTSLPDPAPPAEPQQTAAPCQAPADTQEPPASREPCR